MTFPTTAGAPTLQAQKTVACGEGKDRCIGCLPEKSCAGPDSVPSLAASPYLDHIVVEMFGVAVDQVNLFGVRVVHLLLVHLFCHGLVVGLVDVALFPSGNSVEMSLWRAGQPGGRRMARWWEEKFKKKNKRSEVSPAARQTFRLEIELNASAAVARRTVNSWAPQAF